MFDVVQWFVVVGVWVCLVECGDIYWCLLVCDRVLWCLLVIGGVYWCLVLGADRCIMVSACQSVVHLQLVSPQELDMVTA